MGTPKTDSGEPSGEHLERSRRVWNRRSEKYGRDERDLAPMRETALDYLTLEPGDRVLDVGCGPGVNFERIVEEIGDSGTLVAIDYSPKMVEKARERVAANGWENVEVRQADATADDLGDGFDAAVAMLSLSVMPDKHRAVANIYRSLDDDGSLVVFDVRAIPGGPARIVNPVVRRFFQWYANWNPDGDVIDSLEEYFEECTVVETYFAGIGYTALARKNSGEQKGPESR